MASSINASTSGAGGLITTADNTGILNLQTAGTTAVTVNASQNVGIGTTSPSQRLHVQSNNGQILAEATGASQNPSLKFTAATNNRNWEIFSWSGDAGQFGIYDGVAGQNRLLINTSGNLQFNSGYGSVATAYGCRAWVNFNGTGTVAIRASGNVSSITDRGTGQYTLNFTTSMSDANYNVVAQATGWGAGRLTTVSGENSFTPTASAFQFNTWSYAEVYQDAPYVNLSVFR